MTKSNLRSILAPSLLSAENILAAASLLLIVFFPAVESIARLFKTGVHGSSDYVEHLVVWITFLGGMITSRENRHLSLSAGIDNLKPPYKIWVGSAAACIATAICATLTWNSLTFVQTGFDAAQKVGMLPVRLILCIMPVGFAVITLRCITHAPQGIAPKLIASSGIGIAALLGFYFSGVCALMTWPGIALIIIAGVLGTPIFLVLGGITILLFIKSCGTAIVIPNEAYTMLTGPQIPAIPLFTLAGFILSESKAGERLVRLFRAFFGWLPGGLGIATILICTFFTSLTGASGVTILALGALLSYILIESRYRRDFTLGLITVNGVGILFPPSLPLIMFGVIAQINIKTMFVASLFPGLLTVLALSVFVVIISQREKIKREPLDARQFLPAIRGAFWEIMIPFIILFFYFKGYTTLVETGAITALYVLIIEVFGNHDIRLKDLTGVCVKSIPVMGGVLIVLAVAQGLRYYIIDAEIPVKLTAWMQQYIHSKYVFLLLLNALLLIVGCLMDIFSAIIVLVPLLLPLSEAYGVDPVHLGIIFLANLEVGYLTPPVGINLFLASFRFNEPLVMIYKYVVPFMLVLLVSVLLITYVPWFTTWLPELIKF